VNQLKIFTPSLWVISKVTQHANGDIFASAFQNTIHFIRHNCSLYSIILIEQNVYLQSEKTFVDRQMKSRNINSDTKKKEKKPTKYTLLYILSSENTSIYLQKNPEATIVA